MRGRFVTEESAESLIAKLLPTFEDDIVINRYIVIADGFDSDGRRAIYTACNEGASAWDNMGMLQFALDREHASIIANRLEE